MKDIYKNEVIINFNEDGTADTLYTEKINLKELGDLHMKRASHVEPTDNGQWTADMSPSNGPLLGPFETRTEALQAEVEWLKKNIL